MQNDCSALEVSIMGLLHLPSRKREREREKEQSRNWLYTGVRLSSYHPFSCYLPPLTLPRSEATFPFPPEATPFCNPSPMAASSRYLMNAIIVYLPSGDKKVIIPSGHRYFINSKVHPDHWPTPIWIGVSAKTALERLAGSVRLLIMQLYRWLGGEARSLAVRKWNSSASGLGDVINIGLMLRRLTNSRRLDAIRSSEIL